MATSKLDQLSRQLSIYETIIRKMLDTKKWTWLLKEKLDKMEMLVMEMSPGDQSRKWTTVLSDCWTQYSLLKRVPTLSGGMSLADPTKYDHEWSKADDSVWKILISPSKIVVLSNVERKAKCFEFSLDSDDSGSMVNGFGDDNLKQNTSGSKAQTFDNRFSHSVVQDDIHQPKPTNLDNYDQKRQTKPSNNSFSNGMNDKSVSKHRDISPSKPISQNNKTKDVSIVHSERKRNVSGVLVDMLNGFSKSVESNEFYYQSPMASKKVEQPKTVKSVSSNNQKNVYTSKVQQEDDDDFSWSTTDLPPKASKAIKSLNPKDVPKIKYDSLYSPEEPPVVSSTNEVYYQSQKPSSKPLHQVMESRQKTSPFKAIKKVDDVEEAITCGKNGEDFNWCTDAPPKAASKKKSSDIQSSGKQSKDVNSLEKDISKPNRDRKYSIAATSEITNSVPFDVDNLDWSDDDLQKPTSKKKSSDISSSGKQPKDVNSLSLEKDISKPNRDRKCPVATTSAITNAVPFDVDNLDWSDDDLSKASRKKKSEVNNSSKQHKDKDSLSLEQDIPKPNRDRKYSIAATSETTNSVPFDVDNLDWSDDNLPKAAPKKKSSDIPSSGKHSKDMDSREKDISKPNRDQKYSVAATSETTNDVPFDVDNLDWSDDNLPKAAPKKKSSDIPSSGKHSKDMDSREKDIPKSNRDRKCPVATITETTNAAPFDVNDLDWSDNDSPKASIKKKPEVNRLQEKDSLYAVSDIQKRDFKNRNSSTQKGSSDVISYGEEGDDFNWSNDAPLKASKSKQIEVRASSKFKPEHEIPKSVKDCKKLIEFEIAPKISHAQKDDDLSWSDDSVSKVLKNKSHEIQCHKQRKQEDSLSSDSEVMEHKKKVSPAATKASHSKEDDGFNWSTDAPPRSSIRSKPMTSQATKTVSRDSPTRNNFSSKKTSISGDQENEDGYKWSRFHDAPAANSMPQSRPRALSTEFSTPKELDTPPAMKLLKRLSESQQNEGPSPRNYQQPEKDFAAIRADLHSDYDKLPVTESLKDIEGLRRILWPVSKTIRLLKSVSAKESDTLDKEFVRIALSKLSPQIQALYFEADYGESLREMGNFLRKNAPVRNEDGQLSRKQGSNGGSDCSNNSIRSCNYCKQAGHMISECQMLKVTVCFNCYEQGHSAKRCTNEPLINMKKSSYK